MIQMGAPCSQACWSNSPRPSRGVWHSAHFATSSTKYLPRSISAVSGDRVLDFAGPIETASATVRSNTEKPDFFCITPPENSCFQWEFTCVTGARKRRRTPRWPVPGSYYLSPIRRVLASSCFRAFPIVLLRQETVRTQLGHRRDEVRRRRHMSSVQRTESRE